MERKLPKVEAVAVYGRSLLRVRWIGEGTISTRPARSPGAAKYPSRWNDEAVFEGARAAAYGSVVVWGMTTFE
jgi:hypothetical protein